MAEQSIFEGVKFFDKDSGIHEQVSVWGSVERDDQVFDGLKIFAGGSENHDQGHELDGFAQFLAEAEGRTDTHYLDQLDQGVDHVIEHVRSERTQGHCRKEVMSSSYWGLSALYRVGALDITLRLIDHFPDHQGLRELAGELIVWVKIDRWLLGKLRASNGLIRPAGIRQKHKPEVAGSELLHMLSHCWDQPVTEPVMRALLDALESPSPEKLQRRTHAVIAMRLYLSPEGLRIEELTRGGVPGRLSTEVGVKRYLNGGYSAVMPSVEVIPESDGGPPQVVWGVEVGRGGELIERIATNDLAHPADRKFPVKARRGDTITHPLGLMIPDGWLVIGPNSPLPDAPPWTGEGPAVEPPEPPRPVEPKPANPAEPDQPTPEEIERAGEIIRETRRAIAKEIRTGEGAEDQDLRVWRRRLHDALVALRARDQG